MINKLEISSVFGNHHDHSRADSRARDCGIHANFSRLAQNRNHHASKDTHFFVVWRNFNACVRKI